MASWPCRPLGHLPGLEFFAQILGLFLWPHLCFRFELSPLSLAAILPGFQIELSLHSQAIAPFYSLFELQLKVYPP